MLMKNTVYTARILGLAVISLLLVACSKDKGSRDTKPAALSFGTTIGSFQSSSYLNVPIVSNIYDSYSYKVGEAGSTDCSEFNGYSEVFPISTPINADISILPDGEIRLCIKATQSKDPNAAPAYISSVWIKDAQGPSAPVTPTLGSVPDSLTMTPTLSWGDSTDNGPSGIGLYKVQIFKASDDSAITSLKSHKSGQALSGVSLVNGEDYYFKVIAYDKAGNASSEAKSANWTASQSIGGGASSGGASSGGASSGGASSGGSSGGSTDGGASGGGSAIPPFIGKSQSESLCVKQLA